MDKPLLITLIIVTILYSLPYGFSADPIIIGEGIDPNFPPDPTIDLETAQQTITQISVLSQKIDELSATQTGNLETVAGFITTQIQDNNNSMIIYFILISLSTLGLHWAITLYFQSKGLLLWQKKTQTPQKNQSKNQKMVSLVQ